uniref:Large ribosomal subunit protein uL2c n=2 Tax=Selaginella TaxID=3246 RepID=A0A482A0A5_SELUN|nr:ribosomal protein L2 [Selaginella uncinata]YP_009589553.1 ribosomal protein L2 [Selaginella hainanensis]QBL07908.1 ribosomal protein L2 [Selaginella uncinata]QBL76133.1 ribosomal protein L2 [Selaginella hainanensis]
MAIRLYRACTPGTRNRSVLDSGDTVRSDPHRGLTSGFTPRRGRNNRGIVTSRHRGGGHKRPYRHIDPRRSKRGVPGRIITVEYDPNRSAYISPVHHGDGDKGYISHPEGIRVGDAIPTGPGAPTTVGNAPPPTHMPLGTVMHGIEVAPGKGGQSARAAGAPAKPVAKEGQSATSRLPPGEVRSIPQNRPAVVGQAGNVDSKNRASGKAGSKRWPGSRPRVRGVVMNPVDHPHGGGEGRAPVGRKKPLTPWGRAALGRRSRRMDRYSDNYILRRRRTSRRERR